MIYIFVFVFQAIEEPEKQEYLKQELWIKDKFDVSFFTLWPLSKVTDYL